MIDQPPLFSRHGFAGAVSAAVAFGAQAQTMAPTVAAAASATLEQVVVTAQKRT